MDPKTNRIYSIIAKSLTSQLDNQERRELDEWKMTSTENFSEFNDLVELWTRSGALTLPYAINHYNALKKIRNHPVFKPSQKWSINIVIQVAAVLILSLIFSGIYVSLSDDYKSHIFSNAASVPIYQEVKAAFGTQARVELADGTVVFLNSGSKLRFPQTFDNQEQRKVLLDGEGYFSVTKNPDRPFVVQVHQMNIKVLGTTFNIEAYNDNPFVNIALIEGSVLLQEQLERDNKDLMQLSPNQVATLNKLNNKLFKKNVSDLYKYTAWINGRIVFYDDPIETVVNKLAKWYNVDIVIADKRLENYRFTGTFIDESLEQILNILSMTSPMTYEIKSSVKQADNSMSKRKIILKGKNLN